MQWKHWGERAKGPSKAHCHRPGLKQTGPRIPSTACSPVCLVIPLQETGLGRLRTLTYLHSIGSEKAEVWYVRNEGNQTLVMIFGFLLPFLLHLVSFMCFCTSLLSFRARVKDSHSPVLRDGWLLPECIQRDRPARCRGGDVDPRPTGATRCLPPQQE